MSIKSIKTGAHKRSMLVGNSLGGDFFYLDEVTLSSTSATVTFTSIPQTFLHLQIRAIIKQSAGSGAYATFNSDTGSNYNRHRVIGTGTSIGGYAETTQNQVNINTNMGYSDFGVLIMDILDYSDTNKYKTEKHLAGTELNGSGQIVFEHNMWKNTNAITSISFTSPTGGHYSQYSHFTLYGVK